MKSFIYIPEISIYIFINIKISIKRCKNVEFFTKNALQTGKCKILFKIVEKVSKYEKNNTIHNGCWRSGPEVFLVRVHHAPPSPGTQKNTFFKYNIHLITQAKKQWRVQTLHNVLIGLWRVLTIQKLQVESVESLWRVQLSTNVPPGTQT